MRADTLDLDNEIEDEGSIAVAEALEVNHSLQTLDIPSSFPDFYFYIIILESLSFNLV